MPGWLARFQDRHGDAVVTSGEALTLSAPDGATAELWPPPGADPTSDLDAFLTAAARPRRLGLLLVRQASVAVGLADGAKLTASKVDSSYVQSRTAAGGWSQQRFARRRVNQAKAAAGSAADIVARLLTPAAGHLDAVVTGGDRRTVDGILADPRLTAVAGLRAERFLDVGEPRLATLEEALTRARSVLIRVRDADDRVPD